ncbi:MAG: hypothetical protein ABIQ27_10250 [Flavobacterium sp.]|uniref:hypothetical protein n=1 Tax=Flavobacterium sp. TaxID=239 RepID=UPI0032676413
MIYVFKTSVKNKKQSLKLKPHIDKILPKAQWNFDLEDCDKILRVDSKEPIVSAVIELLETHNYYCEELE